MEIDEEYIDKVQGLIEQKDTESVKALLADLHPADIAELCNDLDVEEARFIYRLLDNETAADVLVEMDEDSRKDLLEALPSETIAKKFVDYMDTDDPERTCWKPCLRKPSPRSSWTIWTRTMPWT